MINENIHEELDLQDNAEDVVERAKDAKTTTKRLLKYLAKQKLKFYAILISVLFSTSLSIAAPLVIGKAIDKIYAGIKSSLKSSVKFNVDINTMRKIIGLLLLIYIFSSLLKYLEQYIMSGVSQTLTLGMRKELSEKLNHLPLKYYDSHKKGDILSRATNDLERLSDSLQEGLMQLITSTITIIIAVIIMLTINPVLTLIAGLTLAISLFTTTRLSHKIENYFYDNQKKLGELNNTIEEAFTGHLVIKAFGMEKSSLQDFKKVNQKLYEANKKAEFSSYAIEPFMRFLGKIGYVIITIISGIFVVQGTMTIGSIQAFIQYVDMCFEPMTEISYVLNMLQSAIASAERFFEIMDEAEEVQDTANNKIIENSKGKVVFEHVKFGYTSDKILMQDINLNLNSGNKIAIVGPTGAGKTTFVNLLMRFYELQGGKIFVDGIDIRDLPRRNLRKLFGMVLQDTWLFHGSIKDNIAYGCPKATLEEIITSARAARIDHFIRTLPKGYQTILDEDGCNLSQGQKQLLTIARAILTDPAILILDEATSSVDTRTEIEIQKAMNNLMKGRTSFIIAHRLSTIRDADLILVMDKGTIIEQGNHDELMSKRGFYERLYNSQFTA